jgi:predicted MFS family arabinose efflux permease
MGDVAMRGADPPADPPGRRRVILDPQFRKYLASETLGEFAFTISGLAISLTAVLVLSAGAFEMGALGAARTLPFLLIGLLAGVIVDRGRRQSILVATSLTLGLLLASVPAAAFTGLLRIELLYLVAFGTGAMSVIGTVAYQSFLPVLVGRGRLVEANSLVQLSSSAALIAGPGLAGLLVAAVTAPATLLVAAALSVAAALLLYLVNVAEPQPVEPGSRPSIVRQVHEGLRIVTRDPALLAITLTGATHNFCSNGMLTALYVLFATETLGLTAPELGLVFAAGGPGAIIGSLVAGRLSETFGVGPTIGVMQVLTGVARMALPLAALVGPPMVVLALGEFLLGTVRSVLNINGVSLRQRLTPDHQQGRMNASIRFIMWAAVPVGSLLAGWLGTAIGLVPTLWIGVVGTFGASLWIFASPLARARDQEELAKARIEGEPR